MRTSPSALRLACALLSGGLLAALLVIVGVPQDAEVATEEMAPVSGSTYLCEGYAGCRDAGYGNAGYAAVNDRSYWNMYPGHNCTNYVAYRMIQAGMSSKRPFGYPGNATNWGEHMSHITDNQARVGAVAWWKAYDNGSGSAGHVAYVEKVTKDYIIISEDSWGWTFHWRRIDRGSSRWPTGFIHFVDKVIENTERPRLRGAAELGGELRTTNGSWNVAPDRYQYKWFADWKRIEGADQATFTVGPEHVGKRIHAKVLARKEGWEKGKQRTWRTRPAEPGTMAVAREPSVSGDTVRGAELRVDVGAYQPRPDSVRVQWLADGEPIAGANRRTFVPDDDQVSAAISARVTLRKAAHSDLVLESQPTDWIRKGYLEAAGDGSYRGHRKVGSELRAVPGTAKPGWNVTPTYQWLRNGQPIEGATKRRYTPTAEDFNKFLKLQITYTHPKRYSDTETVWVGRVKARTRLTVDTELRRQDGRQLVVIARVDPRWADATVDATVVVKVDGRKQVKQLTDGTRWFFFHNVPYGPHDVRVIQRGNSRFAGSGKRLTVDVVEP